MSASKEVRRVSIVRTDSSNSLHTLSTSNSALSLSASGSTASLASLARSPSAQMPALATEVVEDVSTLTNAFGTSAAGIASARAALRGLRVHGGDKDGNKEGSNTEEGGCGNNDAGTGTSAGNTGNGSMLMARHTRHGRSSARGLMSVGGGGSKHSTSSSNNHSTSSNNVDGNGTGSTGTSHSRGTVINANPNPSTPSQWSTGRSSNARATLLRTTSNCDSDITSNGHINDNGDGDGDTRGHDGHTDRPLPHQRILENRLSEVSFQLECVGGDVSGTDNGVDLQARRMSLLHSTSNTSVAGGGNTSNNGNDSNNDNGGNGGSTASNTLLGGIDDALPMEAQVDNTATIHNQIEVASLVSRLRRSSDAQLSMCSEGSGDGEMV